MKTCKYCGKSFPENQFEVALTTPEKVYRRLKCKRCKQNTQNIRVRANAQWIQEHKRTVKCERCGISDYRVLHFHHKKPSDKGFEISNSCGRSLDSIRAEIKKCEVLCANCHAIEHHGV